MRVYNKVRYTINSSEMVAVIVIIMTILTVCQHNAT